VTQVRWVSYNVKSCQQGGLDGVVAVLGRLEPDVVGLQEVDRGTQRAGGADQAAELARRLGLRYHAFGAATPWPGGGEYGVALLSRLPIAGVRTWPLWVPSDPDVDEGLREPRTLLSATVELPGGAARVFVTHLGLGARQRAAQARELAAAADQAAVHGPVAILGDLNAPPDAGELAPLFATWRDAHGDLPRRKRGTFPAGADLAHGAITDYVLLPRQARVSDARVVPDVEGASDHNLCLVVTTGLE
jgi:endonuclease/exonuclease/phosphatase family metal-dependent hydrolase